MSSVLGNGNATELFLSFSGLDEEQRDMLTAEMCGLLCPVWEKMDGCSSEDSWTASNYESLQNQVIASREEQDEAVEEMRGQKEMRRLQNERDAVAYQMSAEFIAIRREIERQERQALEQAREIRERRAAERAGENKISPRGE